MKRINKKLDVKVELLQTWPADKAKSWRCPGLDKYRST